MAKMELTVTFKCKAGNVIQECEITVPTATELEAEHMSYADFYTKAHHIVTKEFMDSYKAASRLQTAIDNKDAKGVIRAIEDLGLDPEEVIDSIIKSTKEGK